MFPYTHNLLAAIHTENACVLLLGISPTEIQAYMSNREEYKDVPWGPVILLSLALRLFNQNWNVHMGAVMLH